MPYRIITTQSKKYVTSLEEASEFLLQQKPRSIFFVVTSSGEVMYPNDFFGVILYHLGWDKHVELYSHYFVNRNPKQFIIEQNIKWEAVKKIQENHRRFPNALQK